MRLPFGRITVAGLLAIVAAFAQSSSDSTSVRPDFSGTWRLNVQRSGPILPRGLEALTLVIDHHDPFIRSFETRTGSGQVKKIVETEAEIDGREHVSQPKPGSTEKLRQGWAGDALLKHWELSEDGKTYISDIRQTLSGGGKVLVMSEHYQEPGLERIRDWIFEKQ
jgi:hypothetical protein